MHCQLDMTFIFQAAVLFVFGILLTMRMLLYFGGNLLFLFVFRVTAINNARVSKVSTLLKPGCIFFLGGFCRVSRAKTQMDSNTTPH